MKKLLCLFGVLFLVVGCSKEEVDDGGSMLYSSDEYDLSVLMCGTLDGNKDIYVGDYTMYYDNTMCK